MPEATARGIRRTACALLLLALCGGAILLAQTAPWWWCGELACHWSLHAALAAIPAAIVLRRSRWGALAVILILVGLWPRFIAAWQPRAAAPAPGPATTLVAVANCYIGSRDRPAALARVADADLVAFIECTEDDRERLRGDRRWPYQVWCLRGEHGVALLSRHPLRELRQPYVHACPLAMAVVEAPAGAFTAIGVHPTAPMRPELARWRDQALDALAGLAEATPGPVLLLGDLNCSTASPAWRRFIAASGLRRCPGATPASWPVLPVVGIAIDHVLVRGGLAAGPAESRRLPGSDHRAVLARVAVAP